MKLLLMKGNIIINNRMSILMLNGKFGTKYLNALTIVNQIKLDAE